MGGTRCATSQVHVQPLESRTLCSVFSVIAPLDPTGSSPGVREQGPAALGDVQFFVASDPNHGEELWRTVSKSLRPVLVKDITPGASGTSISGLVSTSEFVYFRANGDIWCSDGTANGTTRLTSLSGNGSLISTPVVAGEKVFFKEQANYTSS